MATKLTDIYEVVDRSIYKAIYNILVEHDYTPDVNVYNTKQSFNQRLKDITDEKGFAIEIFGHSSPEARGNKKVPRIVYNPLRYVPGELGLSPGKTFIDNGINFKTYSSQIKTSDSIFEVFLVSSNSKQDRLLHSILNAAITNRGYIKFYNNSEKEFYVEQIGERVDPDIREGIIEKVYVFKADDLFESEPVELDETTKITDININDLRVQNEP